ncbi:TRAP transporter small permease (plasmid) [Thioclava sp. 'Guangxiensis']|uniref:TRAP transporter small permease n=1 Tax=Thioclava sp. 'Guangxiensis' TaxID=3149044 RepID=UPI0032C3FC90
MSWLANFVHKLSGALRLVVSGIVIVLLAVMLVSVLVQVAGRYLFNYPISSASEIATFAQILLVLFGSGIALARGQHVAIDMLPAMLPRNAARLVLVAINAVIIAFLAVLCYGTQPLIAFGKFQTSPALGLPMMYIYMTMPVAGIYMMIEALDACIRRWNDPFPRPDVPALDEAA